VWFYSLGVLLALAAGASADAIGIGTSVVALAGGGLVLVALLVGESDNAFADIYSAAVSAQNVAPDAPQRALIAGVGVAGLVLALAFTMESYEVFLLLIGSVFVPLFGVFAADYFVLRRGRYGEEELFAATGLSGRALVPWFVGFVLYHWSVPTGPRAWFDAVRTVFHDWMHLPFPLLGSRLGASIPSFAVAFLLSLILMRSSPGAATGRSDEGSVAGPRSAE
jgi:purine-cytosine permease-like protein